MTHFTKVLICTKHETGLVLKFRWVRDYCIELILDKVVFMWLVVVINHSTRQSPVPSDDFGDQEDHRVPPRCRRLSEFGPPTWQA